MNLFKPAMLVWIACLTLVNNRCLTAEVSLPADYSALLKQYNSITANLRNAKTDFERNQCVQQQRSYPAKFLEWAEKGHDEVTTLTALKQAIQALSTLDSAVQIVWETNTSSFPEGITDDLASRIVSALKRDHIQSEHLGPICDRMRYSYRREFGEFLIDVVQQNPNPEIQGLACISSAQFYKDRLSMRDLMMDRPDLVWRYTSVFGPTYVKWLQQLSSDRETQRMESLLEQAVKQYANVRLPNGGLVGEQAALDLYEIRHLSVGRRAPEITGQDENGQLFHLSDYRGKVVLLYFWSHY